MQWFGLILLIMLGVWWYPSKLRTNPQLELYPVTGHRMILGLMTGLVLLAGARWWIALGSLGVYLILPSTMTLPPVLFANRGGMFWGPSQLLLLWTLVQAGDIALARQFSVLGWMGVLVLGLALYISMLIWLLPGIVHSSGASVLNIHRAKNLRVTRKGS